MLRRRVPTYCLHKRSGHARVKVDGREVFLGKYNSPESLERYQRIIAEFKASPTASTTTAEARDGMTVVEMLAAYLDYAEDYYRHSNQLINIKAGLRPLRENYGRTPAARFGPRSLKTLQQTMVEADLSRGLINKRIRYIVRLFRWAAAEELLPAAVPDALRQVEGLRQGFCQAREPERVKPVDDETVNATLPHLPFGVADMVRVQRLTGARPTEVCIMRPADIDRSGEVWTYRPTEHKTSRLGKERIIHIGPQAQTVLLPYFLRADGAYCFSPAESERKRRTERHEQRRVPLSCGT